MKTIFKLLILGTIAVSLAALTFWLQITDSNKTRLSEVCVKENCYKIELAQTSAKRERGLMFRQSLDKDRGMLFIFEQSGIHNFWMKNTLIPLDIVWIDSNNEIVFISENTPPCAADSCPLISPTQNARYVLEINAGQIKKISAKIGDQVIFK